MKEPTVVSRKVAVLGFRACGKSSLINVFVTGTFTKTYDPTIESTLHKTIRFRKVHLQTDIVDTAGMVRACVHTCSSRDAGLAQNTGARMLLGSSTLDNSRQ